MKFEELNARELDEFKKKAQTDAEKNISEIERNIQAQNQRLDEEADVQGMELDFMEDKN